MLWLVFLLKKLNKMRELLKVILIWLIKKGLIKAPKKHVYAVEAQVLLDGEIIHRFPSELLTSSRRAARFETKKRLSFKTGTTAKNLEWHGSQRLFEVPLSVMVDGKVNYVLPVRVLAGGRREAKFELTKRIEFKTGLVARKDHLIKHS